MLSTLHRSRDLHDFWAGIVAGARGELASCSDRPLACCSDLSPAPDHLGPGSRSSLRTAAWRTASWAGRMREWRRYPLETYCDGAGPDRAGTPFRPVL